MGTYFQIVAGALVAVILGLTLSKHGKDISVLLGIAVCCMVLAAAVNYLKPVMDLISKLESIGQLDNEWISVMLKAAGIGLIAELASLICADSGNNALGKTIQILACAAVLWLSVPLMTALIDLIQKILGEI